MSDTYYYLPLKKGHLTKFFNGIIKIFCPRNNIKKVKPSNKQVYMDKINCLHSNSSEKNIILRKEKLIGKSKDLRSRSRLGKGRGLKEREHGSRKSR